MAWLDSWAYHLTRDTWRDDLSTHISEAGFIQRVENVSPSQEEQTQPKLNKYTVYLAILHKNLVCLGSGT